MFSVQRTGRANCRRTYPVVIPDDDLTRALGFQAKIGFQILVANEVYVNIDIGVEHVGKVIEIKQTDLVFAIGLGYGLF